MDINELGGFTPQVYFMKPETDDVLPDGTHLREGMIVLVEQNKHREDIRMANVWTALESYRAQRYNRWCKIRNLSIDTENRTVTFVGEYAEGFKSTRVHDLSTSWIVKLESLEDIENGPEGMPVDPKLI